MKKIYILFILLAQVTYGQISIGQESTFSTDNDFEGWDNLNTSFTPVSVAGGFLTASGSPSIFPGTLPPNRLILDNITWGGNYTSVGVGGIRFDARNLSGEDMELVILLFDNETGTNVTSAESLSITVPASATNFETYTISLLPAVLTVDGPKSLDDLLIDVLGLSITRIDDNGDGTESLDFDNIRVLSVADLSREHYLNNNTAVRVFVNAGTLNVTSSNSTIKTVRIYNIAGKLISESLGNKANVSALSNGAYVAVIEDANNQVVSRKFIK
ncbi:T9SS type A sorting domain-containing protein [Lacinutrix sp. MEBiC02404]